MQAARWFRIGAIWGFLGVALGALGAHGLEDQFRRAGEMMGRTPEAILAAHFGLPMEDMRRSPQAMAQIYRTGAQYHMYSALAILGVGAVCAYRRPGVAASLAGWSLLLGSLVFSGTLYLLAVTGERMLGAITPLGGVGMMVGWIALAVAAGGSSPHSTVQEP